MENAPTTLGKTYTVIEDMDKDALCVTVITDNDEYFGYYAYRYRLSCTQLNKDTKTL
jgi:hypothetical protein